ncbi:ahpC/TSA family protein [Neorickettsia helminthoeca str. Oregon]|uniref:AhpC/TSA family protein n=1 Tax=Neorickettsia helminthoeca str. Oregon TaxID=1286528 RepID=X5H4I0_9RICK|nr:SCO family protein [Neorickettsia helminthoeca]AHX11471.1 ahpC/TSA family protein [Neorickettsia helminthoeca str. Oregon]
MKKIWLALKLMIVVSIIELPYQTIALNRATTVAPVEIGGTFDLTDQEGHQVTEQILKGKYSIVLFGFSRCPHVCPVQLSILAKSLDASPKLQAIFITLDPKRDTVERLDEFSKSFHERILMLTGTEEMIKKVVNDYKVYVEANEDPERFNHSTIMYLIGPDGNYVTHFTPRDEDELLAYIKEYAH